MTFLLYLVAVAALAVSFDQFRVANASVGTRPDVGITPLLFQLSGVIGGFGSTAMLIAGFFLGKWWWPLVAIVIAVVASLVFRASVAKWLLWFFAIAGSVVGIVCSVVLFATR